jgi:uncharacterized protein YdcH (DUF465 family)
MFHETTPTRRYPAENLLTQIRELDAHISRLIAQAKELQKKVRTPEEIARHFAPNA